MILRLRTHRGPYVTTEREWNVPDTKVAREARDAVHLRFMIADGLSRIEVVDPKDTLVCAIDAKAPGVLERGPKYR